MQGIRQNELQPPPQFQHYLSSPGFFNEWGSEDLEFFQEGRAYTPAMWSKAITYKMRVKAIMNNIVYGILANGPYWAGSVVFTLLMKALAGGSYWFHCTMYLVATVLSYVLARVLPLKTFSSDEGGAMRPLAAGLRNGIRMFLPFVLAHVSSGYIGLYSLAATLVVMIVEAGKHALLHSDTNRSSLWANWTFLTDMLERRIAVSGINLPANYLMLRFFVFLQRPEVQHVETVAQKPPITVKVQDATTGRATTARPPRTAYAPIVREQGQPGTTRAS